MLQVKRQITSAILGPLAISCTSVQMIRHVSIRETFEMH